MTNQLPTTTEGMIAHIETSYDRATLLGALEEAQGAYNHAAQQLAQAQAQLAQHEGARPTDPSAWPAWTTQGRQLADVLPIYEQLADAASGELEARRRAIGDARLKVFAALRDQLRTQSQAAATADNERIEQLRREIDQINAGKSEGYQAVTLAEIALRNAAGALRNVN